MVDWIAGTALVLGFLAIVACCVYDMVQQFKKRKRDELRFDTFVRSVQTISEYCYYKGISEGFDMTSDID